MPTPFLRRTRPALLLTLCAGTAIGALATLAAPAYADVEPTAAMLRWPDVSQTHIVFSYANGLWIVPKSGGRAEPIANPPGQESFPRFSPDGKRIAFVGNYDGNRDLYTVPVSGGVPHRVTHHPGGEILCDWAPPAYGTGNELLFLTNGLAGLSRQTQIFSVDAKGGLPTQLPVPYAGFGALSPDGQWLAYTTHSTDSRTWKRYRGGMATDVWLFNINTKQSRMATDWEGTDTLPMWVPGGDGAAFYYISDQGPEHRLNIWKYTLADGRREQITTYANDDVKWPSIGPGDNGQGEIVFQLGSELRLFNLGTRQDRVVKVTIPGDRPTVRTRIVDAARNISSASISPAGKRVAIEARGDIWSAPAKEGVTRNLSRTDGVFERGPAWSSDGRWIAYFSDQDGEYDLWIRPADVRTPAKPADAKAPEKDEGEEVVDEHAWLRSPPRRLTDLGPGFRMGIVWSPDAKHVTYTDNGGRIYLTNIESGDTRTIDANPWGNPVGVSWSHNSAWITYAMSEDNPLSSNGVVYLYNVASGEKHALTSPMFSSGSPAFDRKGEFLYFTSNRIINAPMYSDIDSTFIYTGTQALYMVPLRSDVKNPFALRNDEEDFKKDDKKKDDKKKDEKKDEPAGDNAKNGDKKNNANGEKTDDATADDGLSGTWSGTATSDTGQPPGGIPLTIKISLGTGGSISGTISSPMGEGQITGGSFNKATGALTINLSVGPIAVTIEGTVSGEQFSGSWTSPQGGGTFNANRTARASAENGAGDKASTDKPADAAKDFSIEIDGFERRAIQLPVSSGSFGNLNVTHDGKLIYARFGARGGSEGPSIRIFDPADEAREEKVVTAGAGSFDLSADGKKILVRRGGSFSVMDASAGGGKSSTVPTSGMLTHVDPRSEWRQIFNDTWRLQRDYFYEDTLHGVDWNKVRDHYGRMLEECITREDVAYVQAEMISELNVGHAYLSNPGDVESGPPSLPVGLLGCDFELVDGAYRIARIYGGADWDADARGPLSQLGMNIKEGDYFLAVNGVPVDTSKDPWAALIGASGRVTAITVGPNPAIDRDAREVLVTPTGSEVNLRYRAWIEANRAYVDKASDGTIGYIYVPNTGVDGQSDLFRQFVGQRGKPALIVDDRWNGGGQIPTRFIELLNRPATNFWARRHGHAWPWPPDAHFGPKAMLINGLAGSGGDMFPWLFRHNNLGKLIGMRTWGGLVGISGNPGLIDGGAITVPTFGFYETDGTWGVEGHGVDPDIEVIDDPAKMVNGRDPQLDAAVQHLLEELRVRPFVPPARPASPDRSRMGITEEDK